MEGRADFHIPVPRNPDINNSKLPYQFVTEKLANVTFVIYSHQGLYTGIWKMPS